MHIEEQFSEAPSHIHSKERIRGFLYAALLSLFFVLVESLIFSTLHAHIHRKYEAEQLIELEVISHQIDLELNHIGNDLSYIANITLSQKLLSNLKDTAAYNDLSSLISTVMTLENECDKIRFINREGYEVIRYNAEDGGTVRVPDSELQYKGDRYYFIETMLLGSGEIFISPFDLNMENGVVEEPYKPILRYAKPIYSREDTLLGIAIINYQGEPLLKIMEEFKEHENDEIYLLNGDGFYLKGPSSESEWAFMLPDRGNRSFSSDNPEVWREFNRTSHGITSDRTGRYYYQRILPATTLKGSVKGDEEWFLVIHTPVGVFHSADYLLKTGLIIAFLLLIPLLIIMGWKLGRYQVRHQWFLKELEKRATRDVLTGLYNRRAIMDILERIVSLSLRRESACAIAFIDINDLKQTNDIEGHNAGDALIRGAAHALEHSVRMTDSIARLGGDEFLVVFPDCDVEHASLVMDRAERHFHDLGIERVQKAWSMSWGCTAVNGPDDSADDMVVRADKIMYEHKMHIKAKQGRVPR